MSAHGSLTPEQTRARGRRNVFIALSIGAFIVLVFLITVVKIRENGVAMG